MNALVTIDTLTPATVFAPGGVESIISKLETDVRAISTDVTTDAGRKAIASLAYKVARSKTALDDMGKQLVADLKAQTGKIDAERRVIRDRLDALRDEVRKPLDDFEQAEQSRVAGHEAAIAEIMTLAQVCDEGSEAIKRRLETIGNLIQRDWQEFSSKATAAADEVRKALEAALARTEKQEREAAEAIARAERAEAEKKAAAEKAERDQAAAIEAERKRVADAAAKEAAERAKRERDKAHRAKINNEALAALTALGISAELAKAAVAAIARGEVPHVSIEY